jgi:hypothetical protein
MSHSVTQVKAHCNSCLHESMVDPSVIGKPHRVHKTKGKNQTRWVAGPKPVKTEAAA